MVNRYEIETLVRIDHIQWAALVKDMLTRPLDRSTDCSTIQHYLYESNFQRCIVTSKASQGMFAVQTRDIRSGGNSCADCSNSSQLQTAESPPWSPHPTS